MSNLKFKPIIFVFLSIIMATNYLLSASTLGRSDDLITRFGRWQAEQLTKQIKESLGCSVDAHTPEWRKSFLQKLRHNIGERLYRLIYQTDAEGQLLCEQHLDWFGNSTVTAISHPGDWGRRIQADGLEYFSHSLNMLQIFPYIAQNMVTGALQQGGMKIAGWMLKKLLNSDVTLTNLSKKVIDFQNSKDKKECGVSCFIPDPRHEEEQEVSLEDFIEKSIRIFSDKDSRLKHANMLLHGAEGTGKGMIARLIAQECNEAGIKVKLYEIPVEILLAIPDSQMLASLVSSPKGEKRIILIDEAGLFFTNRNFISDPNLKNRINTLLSAIEPHKDQLVIAATNNFEAMKAKADSATLSRFPFMIKMDVPTGEMRREFIHDRCNALCAVKDNNNTDCHISLSDTFVQKNMPFVDVYVSECESLLKERLEDAQKVLCSMKQNRSNKNCALSVQYKKQEIDNLKWALKNCNSFVTAAIQRSWQDNFNELFDKNMIENITEKSEGFSFRTMAGLFSEIVNNGYAHREQKKDSEGSERAEVIMKTALLHAFENNSQEQRLFADALLEVAKKLKVNNYSWKNDGIITKRVIKRSLNPLVKSQENIKKTRKMNEMAQEAQRAKDEMMIARFQQMKERQAQGKSPFPNNRRMQQEDDNDDE